MFSGKRGWRYNVFAAGMSVLVDDSFEQILPITNGHGA